MLDRWWLFLWPFRGHQISGSPSPENAISTAKQAKQLKQATTRTRRTYGRGTIEARGPDTWSCASWPDRPRHAEAGQQSRRVHGSRRDAERALAELLRQHETHGPTPATEGRLTLHDWMEGHLRTSAKLSERTRINGGSGSPTRPRPLGPPRSWTC